MSPLSRRARWTGLAAIFMTLGCAESDAPIDGTYIARIDETLIAVVVDDPNGVAVAYACDGRDGRVDPVATWFNGSLKDGAARLTHADGSSLTVTIADGAVSGELALTGGAVQTFDGALASDGVLLWATTGTADGDLLGGWIFADDGTQRGAVLKRSIGDTSVTLMSAQTTSVTFDSTALTIKPLSDPQAIQ
jgi:hypothetical protein